MAPGNWRGNPKIHPPSIDVENHQDIWGDRDDQFVAQSWLINCGQWWRVFS